MSDHSERASRYQTTPASRLPLRFAIGVALAYLVITAAYIVISSTVLGREPFSRDDLVQLEIVKGLAFVVLSAGLLFSVVFLFSRRLEQRGQLLAEVFRVAGVPVIITEAQAPHRTLLCNESARRLFGLSLDWRTRPEIRTRLEGLFPDELSWRPVLDGAATSAEWLGSLVQEGHEIPVELRMQRMPQPVDGREALLLTAIDISNVRRFEAELALRERRFGLAMAQYPFPAGIADKDARLTFVNDALVSVFGLQAEQMLGRSYEDLAGPNAVKAMAMVRAALDTGEVQREIITDDFGDPPLIYEVLVTPLKTSDGGVFEVLIVTRDMSEHIRREEAVRKQERTLWSLIEALPIPVSLSRSGSGEILVANQAFHDLYELNGDLSALLAEDAYRNVADRMRMNAEFEEQGFVEGRELQLRTVTGKPISIIANIIPFEYEDEICRLSAVVDVTALRATEAALIHAQRLEAVGRLTGGLAHDFNNLLMTIQISMELLQDGLPSDLPDQSLITTALAAVQRGGDLTHRLLAFSRQQLLKPQRIDLNQRVSDLYPILRSSVGDTVSIAMDLSSDLWEVEVDPAQLDNTLLNLVINARDAMPQGGRVMIATANAAMDGSQVSSVDGEPLKGDFVRISVVDEGHGISDEIKAKLFEPFFTTKLLGKGTGLGLSMVYGFVQQSGGAIDLDSGTGRGAAFHLFFPRSTAFHPRMAHSAPAQASRAPISTSEKVMVLVDDDDALRRSMLRVLQQAGLTVHACPDAHVALQLLKSGSVRPDIVLTDIALPGNFNGLQFATTVRTLLPECRILCMTGHVDPEEIADLGDIRDFEIMRKPFPLAQLTDRIRLLLANSQTGSDATA
ncbi:PAS domain-containing protein [Iodidimonas sp. SYSU 1G8]|uniref:PAS domain-containing hybrid sensor histidine kinase/response regulator n=1 Tax=Iodidimonas sp. SYSU 1G8 TaxID=3133967 RepID=UPI0031FE88E1